MTTTEVMDVIIREEAVRFKDDISAAVESALRRIQEAPWYPDYIAGMVRMSVRTKVGNFRHAVDEEFRRRSGSQTNLTPRPGIGDTTNRIYQSVYDYFIAGTTLGMLTGLKLEETAVKEARIAEGHMFNARLCRKLRAMVPDDKTVKQCVSEKKLRQIFRAAKKEGEGLSG